MMGDTHNCAPFSIPSNFTNNVVLKSSLNNFNGLNFSFLNCRSIFPKIDEIKYLISGVNLDVLCFVETWLHDHIPDTTIALQGYKLYRMDRNRLDVGRGGGLCIYMKPSISAKVIYQHCESNLECLLVELKMKNSTILLTIVYKPPRKNFCNDLENILASYSINYNEIIMCGDFNCDIIKQNSSSKKLIDLIERFDCFVVNNIPTYFSKYSCSQLDLVISNNDNIQFINQISVGFTDHDFLYFSYKIDYHRPKSTIIYRDYKNVNLHNLLTKSDNLPWNDIYLILDPTDKVVFLSKMIADLYDEFIPLKTLNLKVKVPPWFDDHIIELIALRDFVRHRWNVTKYSYLHQEFKSLRNRVNNAIKFAKRKYECERLNPTLPPKTFWKNLKQMYSITDELPSSSAMYSSDEFNDFFALSDSSQQNCNIINTSETNECEDGEFSFKSIDVCDFTFAINTVTSNSTGVDNIPIKFIKLLLPSIDCFIIHVFNSIITSSVYPLSWKISKIIPLPKKKNATNLAHFRPISLLPSLSKVLERILQSQIMEYVRSKKLIDNFQSAYRGNHSTTTALLSISDDIRRALDNNKLCTLVLLDFSKAFDRVDYSILIKKLKSIFNFSSSACRLILSYLTDRFQLVFHNGTFSGLKQVTMGVPQGSILGPFLFIFYINDISTAIKNSGYHLFADDVQIYRFCNADQISQNTAAINEDIEQILKWSVNNNLLLNCQKSQCIFISNSIRATYNLPSVNVNGTPIAYSDKINNLGVIFDKTLCWNYHVDMICKRIYNLLRILWTTTRSLCTKLRLKLVKTYILPHLFYGDVVIYQLQNQYFAKLQLVHNACVRYIYRLRKYDHISAYSKSLFGCSLGELYNYRICYYLFKILKFGEPKYLFDKLFKMQSLRLESLKPVANKTRLMNCSLFVRGIREWNALPSTVKKSKSATSFKRAYYQHFSFEK